MRRTRVSQLVQKFVGKGVSVFCSLALLIMGIAVNGVVPSTHAKVSEPQMIDVPEVCTERGPSSFGAAALKDRVWKGKSELRVRFLGGSKFLRDQVRHYAQFWSNYGNIQFVFVESAPSDIRVSFNPNGTSWSYIGNGAKNVDESDPTMNFGWFDENTAEVKFRRTILHEFGHALGLIHEHQSPAAGISWNKQAVYQYYKEHFEWNKNVVNDNIIQKYAERRTQRTTYDPNSIMNYPIPKKFTTDGTSIEWNTNLSKMDKAFVKEMYP